MLPLSKYKWFYLVLVLIMLTNSVFYFIVRDQNKKDFMEIGSIMTMQASKSLELGIENQQKLSSLIIRSHEVLDWIIKPTDDSSTDVLSAYLSNIISQYPQYENIQVMRFTDPKQLWSSLENGEYKLDGMTLRARPDQQYIAMEDTGTVEAFSDKRPYYISSIFSIEPEGDPLFYFSVPLILNQEMRGILTFTVKLSALTDLMINQLEYGKTGYLFLIDDRGKTIAHKNTNFILNDEYYLQDIVNNLLSHLNITESYFRGNFQGDWKKYFGIEIGIDKENMRNQWYIVFTQKEWEVNSLANRMLTIDVVTTLCYILIFALYRKRQIHLEKILIGDQEKTVEKQNFEEELQAKTREVAKQTTLDPLTQINHFQSIQRHIEQYLLETPSNSCVLCLVLFHVDKMGQFNERESIAKGDLILNHIGKLSNEHFNDRAIVGRVYADVFGVIIFQRNLIETLVQVEQFRKKYEEMQLNFINQKPTLSFGIAQWDNETSAQLILRAENQLKSAKRNGERQIKY